MKDLQRSHRLDAAGVEVVLEVERIADLGDPSLDLHRDRVLGLQPRLEELNQGDRLAVPVENVEEASLLGPRQTAVDQRRERLDLGVARSHHPMLTVEAPQTSILADRKSVV